MIDGRLAPVSHLSSNFIAAIFGLLWKQLSYCEPPLLPSDTTTRHYGISQPLLGERMLLVALIKEQMIPRRQMMKLYKQSSGPSLGRAPTHRAICHGKNALSQPAADINYESKATAVPPALPVRRWKVLRGWLGRGHGETTDAARTLS